MWRVLLKFAGVTSIALLVSSSEVYNDWVFDISTSSYFEPIPMRFVEDEITNEPIPFDRLMDHTWQLREVRDFYNVQSKSGHDRPDELIVVLGEPSHEQEALATGFGPSTTGVFIGDDDYLYGWGELGATIWEQH